MKVKEESEKAGFKKSTFTKLRSWHLAPLLHGKYGETVADFIFLGSKITADGDCHEIKRHLLFGRKVVTNLGRHIKKPTKVHLFKAMVFPVIMLWM